MDSVECISIRPSRISVYTQYLRSSVSYSSASPSFDNFNDPAPVAPPPASPDPGTRSKQPNSNSSGFRLSKKAIQRIQDRVDWLVLFSKKKTGYNPKTKKSFYFKINFITLTLPVLQMHDDRTIKSKCFNQFLIEARKRCNLRNFVWRAEAQSNGNIHFHLISDTFLNAYVIRQIWNRCIAKLGYIDSYQSKFSQMNFNQYRNAVDPVIGRAKSLKISRSSGKKFRILRQQNIPVDSLLLRYEYGKSTNWRSPNTTDVHSTKHIRNIAAYLKKYVSKNIDPTPGESSVTSSGEIIDVRKDLKARRIAGRLWSCSQSLSKLKPMQEYTDSATTDFLNDICDSYPEAVQHYDYAICIYVHIRQYARRHAAYLKKLISALLEFSHYSPSSPSDQRYFLDSSISFSP